MEIYRSKVRIIRRLGLLPGLTRKYEKIEQNSWTGNLFLLKRNDHHLLMIMKRLFEKQKLRFNYGVTESS
jgi:hypothetical protein